MDQSKHIPESAQASNAPVRALTGDQMTESRRVRPQLPEPAAEDVYRIALEAIADIAPSRQALICEDPRERLVQVVNIVNLAFGRPTIP